MYTQGCLETVIRVRLREPWVPACDWPWIPASAGIHTCVSIFSAELISNWPGFSRLKTLTTPLSTSIE